MPSSTRHELYQHDVKCNFHLSVIICSFIPRPKQPEHGSLQILEAIRIGVVWVWESNETK